jgi:hypothetical protein
VCRAMESILLFSSSPIGSDNVCGVKAFVLGLSLGELV